MNSVCGARSVGPIHELNGPLVAEPVDEKRQRTQIFVDLARNGVGGLHLNDGVVLAGAGPMHEQVGFGCPIFLHGAEEGTIEIKFHRPACFGACACSSMSRSAIG